ncbi:MAG TPA: AMP-binding protein [Burkholderiales bacterium]
MNLALFLARSARAFPHAPAVALGEEVLYDYGELARRAGSIADALRERFGLGPGDRVALYLDNHPAYLEALYGIWWAGLAAVPINAKLHAREAAYILQASEAALCFVDAAHGAALGALAEAAPAPLIDVASRDYAALLARAARAPAEVEADALAWLFYTSGTTGRPKGAMLSHRNFLTMTACYFMDVDDVGAGDATLYAAPMSHGAGCYNFVFMQRAALHVVPRAGFDPAEIAALGAHYARARGGASQTAGLCMFAAPTMVKRLVEHVHAAGVEPRGIKTIVYGGGPMYLEDIRRALDVMGNRFVQIYGQGESPMTITALSRRHLWNRDHPRWEARAASVGTAQSLVEVRVVDPDGRVLPAGETGEVIVRGPSVMRGYWRDADATAKALRHGWLWTGDLGALDEDGFLTLKDRSKDLIISGGANVYPREVEEVLLRHPNVREVSVVGRKDPEWGEVVVAFVVGEGVTPQELDALCLEHIARFKRPKEYRFIDALPKNNYGKVLKTALREMLEHAGAAGAEAGATDRADVPGDARA